MRNFNPLNSGALPVVIKNLLIINFLLYFITFVLQNLNIDLTRLFGLYLPMSPNFQPYQIITHMFMHSQAGFNHILLNMISLFFFGASIERRWGAKKFLFYYISTGLGAALLHWSATYIEYLWSLGSIPSIDVEQLISNGATALLNHQNYTDPLWAKINSLVNAPIIGASGAVYGIMLAFGMIYSEEYIYMYFFIPVKAKYFVLIIGAFEIIQGFFLSASSVAHFAHLGGMVFGYFILRTWKKNGSL